MVVEAISLKNQCCIFMLFKLNVTFICARKCLDSKDKKQQNTKKKEI